MSAKHPVVAVTGSSGAGTTSVRRTFEQIFRREGINAAYVEGDSFHRMGPPGDEGGAGGMRSSRATTRSEPLRRRGQPVRGARGPVPRLRRDGRRARSAATFTTTRRPRPLARSRARSRQWEDIEAGHRPALLRGPARSGGDRHRSTSPATSTSPSAWCPSSTSSGSRSSAGTSRSAATPPRPSPRRSCGACPTT